MDLLKGAVAAAKKRKAPQSEDADGKRRWVRQSDLQREREKEQEKAVEEAEARWEKASREKQERLGAYRGAGVSGLLPSAADEPGAASSSRAGDAAEDDDEDADVEIDLPVDEVIRRLRGFGQPVTLFGEVRRPDRARASAPRALPRTSALRATS